MNGQQSEKNTAQETAATADNQFAPDVSGVTAAKKRGPAVFVIIALCLVLVLAAGGITLYFTENNAVASVIFLDVNPAVELAINSKEKVLSCTAMNAEAAQVLFEMNGGADLEGAKLDLAVNALVGALVRHGYLEDASAMILISVEDKNNERAVRLQQELEKTVDAALREKSSDASVLSQNLPQNNDLEQQAHSGNISVGKAALIEHVISINGNLEFDRLAKLSIEELEELIKSGAPAMPIGIEAAKAAAMEYAGITADERVVISAEPELDDNPPCYEVEIYDFEYKVAAYTGEILSGQRDIKSVTAAPETTPEETTEAAPTETAADTTVPENTQSNEVYIGEAAAKQAALNHAKIKEADTSYCNCYLEYDDGYPEYYEVEFAVGNTVYKYEIGLYSGNILEYELESHQTAEIGGVGNNNGNGGNSGSGNNSGNEGNSSTGNSGSGNNNSTGNNRADSLIGEDAAKMAALKHANIKETDTSYCYCYVEYDDGYPECYKVEFASGDTLYKYEIGLYSGKVLECKHESHHDGSHHHSTAAIDIGQEAALAAALKDAGLNRSDIYDLEIERDIENNRIEYEIEFRAMFVEYKYVVDGYSGQILERETEVEGEN